MKDSTGMFEYPDTQAKRQAGMARFRAQMRAAHEKCANDPKLSDADRAFQRELLEFITVAQKRFGEV